MTNKYHTRFMLSMILFALLILPGCWNYKEIDSLGIITGLTIDEGKDSKYLVAVKVVVPGNDFQNVPETRIFEMEGETLFDAVRNMIQIFPHKLFFSHLGVVIISETIAEQGMIPLLDFLIRDAEPRKSVSIFISKDNTAKGILDNEKMFSGIHPYEIESMLASQKSVAKAPINNLHSLMKSLMGDGISAVLPVIDTSQMSGKSITEVSGTAVFDKDVLIGYLDEEQTKYFLFVRDQIEGGLLVYDSNIDSSETKLALEILQMNTKLTPIIASDSPSIKIEVSGKVTLADYGVPDIDLEQDQLLTIKKEVDDYLEQQIQALIETVQKDYAVDIFGFGSIIKAKKPHAWRSLQEDWNHVFQNLEFEVMVDIEIVNTAFSIKQFKVGD